ncbi:hypothetical protein ALGA_4288 [Labilibaculum antarcticum]|uniref:GH16 domain-containing protein n=2 Tax=Labilibaculum antarcticum TaxID=1717717 RepID=A0A1Y1CQ63_9BACT|nr:hypothetical protein ALGA_4288 [Labilibaculum antarcticum]
MLTDKSKNSEEIVKEVRVEAEDYTGSSNNPEIRITKSGDKYVRSEKDGWIAFDVNVPIAGRYKTQISLSSADSLQTCWIEDHCDNKDDRNYNITSAVLVPKSTSEESFTTVFKDGSPLNLGVHKMKLHLPNAKVNIDWIKFTLLQEHTKTPKLLTQSTTGEKWVIVWSDEFEKNGLPDSTKWNYDLGNWGWGNSELQYYTHSRAENARVEDGNLIIEGRKDDMGQKWTSARLTTRGKVSFLYGKIEFRAKVPHNKGNWAAGWTLGDEYLDELSWPYCGEIDILESVGYEMDDETGNGIAHASAHSAARYFKLGNQPTNTVEVKNMNGEYHTYGVEWSPDYVKIYVDDKHYFSYTDNSTELSWPFGKAQNIILNLAIGGGWGGYYGIDETISSQKMIIDYVRVYELQ